MATLRAYVVNPRPGQTDVSSLADVLDVNEQKEMLAELLERREMHDITDAVLEMDQSDKLRLLAALEKWRDEEV